ncbi:nucleotide-diphosphate-sugar epimerase [Phytomonospora endophytica]|nr:nucleotide-diphosphate-sugar epimerase [Phytomonospora endophytica]
MLVTGATGTVGREVVRQLIAAGIPARALVRAPDRAALAGAELAAGDLTDPANLAAAFDGVGAVFLVWPFERPDGVEAVLAHAGNARVVYLSVATVDDALAEQTDPNARLHAAVERSVRALAPRWTILRPHAFAANTLRWAEQVRRGVVTEAYGEAAMSLIDEADIAAVAVRALSREGLHGRVLELTGTAPLTKRRQVRTIAEATGHAVRFVETSRADAAAAMLTMGWAPRIVEGILDAQHRMVTDPRPVTGTVEEVIGRPARAFADWAAAHAAHFTPEETR